MQKEIVSHVRFCDLCSSRRKEIPRQAYSACTLCQRDMCDQHSTSLHIGGVYFSISVCLDCYKTEPKALEITVRKERYAEYVAQEAQLLERWSLRVQRRRALKRRPPVILIHDARYASPLSSHLSSLPTESSGVRLLVVQAPSP